MTKPRFDEEQMMQPSRPYSEPIDRLLSLGRPDHSDLWPDYPSMGLTAQHVPELIQMAIDPVLNGLPSDDPAIWGPLHAWRALGQLRAVEAIEPLVSLLPRIEENDDDWVGEELPVVFGMIGIAALEPLRRYAGDDRNLTFARVAAAGGIKRIGMTREHREVCAAALAELLDRAGESDPTFNALVIADLCDLHARQHLQRIERAFAKDCVDVQACGELASVRARLGVAPPAASRRSPRYRDFQIEMAIDQVLPPAPEKPKPDWMKDFLA